MAGRSFYQLLLEAMQNSNPGMAPDDPAEIARHYPQTGVPDGSHSEAQTRFPPPVDVPPREERRLSLARFAAEALASAGSNVPSSLPNYPWTAPAQAPGYASLYGAGLLPVRGGQGFAVSRFGGLGSRLRPPLPIDLSKLPKLDIPDSWKVLGAMLMFSHPSLRERFLGQGDDSKVGDLVAGQISEWHQAKKPGDKSKTSPGWMQNAPGAVPDADADASAAAAALADANDFCGRRFDKEEKRCGTKFPKNYHGCRQNAFDRMTKCYANKGTPSLDEVDIWDYGD